MISDKFFGLYFSDHGSTQEVNLNIRIKYQYEYQLYMESLV